MWWELIERFQTVVVGAIGFGGVILTLWINATIARKQRDEERAHQRTAIRAALLAELRVNEFSIVSNLQLLREQRPEEGGGAFVTTDPIDSIYRSVLPTIGLLSENEIHQTLRAYATLETHYANRYLIGVPAHTTPRLVEVQHDNLEVLVGMLDSLLQPIRAAIAALETARQV